MCVKHLRKRLCVSGLDPHHYISLIPTYAIKDMYGGCKLGYYGWNGHVVTVLHWLFRVRCVYILVSIIIGRGCHGGVGLLWRPSF